MLIRIPLGMVISLLIALLLNRAIRAVGFYRTAFYMPAIVPLVASSLLWAWLFNPNEGPINALLDPIFRLCHLPAPLWLNDSNWSKPALIIMGLWTAGAGMIIWLAGLQIDPAAIYEAAALTVPARGGILFISPFRCSARISFSTDHRNDRNASDLGRGVHHDRRRA